ncbi:MAG: ribulose bisphosphate carboxylase small subunit [Deinococcus sp.]|nr:ribulose bisphosphate carboxylase small subunit [Deinococcus sp.]
MRITQGTFSYLPDLTNEEIRLQIEYIIKNGWAVSVEYTDDPSPYNTYWNMWGLPMFDLTDPAAAMFEFHKCREAFPNHYLRINGFDPSPMWQAQRVSFIVHRPPEEPGFRLHRAVYSDGRRIHYTLEPYVTQRPSGDRYQQ